MTTTNNLDELELDGLEDYEPSGEEGGGTFDPKVVQSIGAMGKGKTLSMVELLIDDHKVNGGVIFSTARLCPAGRCPGCGFMRRIDMPQRTAKCEVCRKMIPENLLTDVFHPRWVHLNSFQKVADLFEADSYRVEQGLPLIMANGSILWDEAAKWMDSYLTRSKVNRMLTQLAGDARHRGYNMYITLHRSMKLDPNVRVHITHDITPIKHPETDTMLVKVKERTTNKKWRYVFRMSDYYPFYDTKEVIYTKGKYLRPTMEDLA